MQHKVQVLVQWEREERQLAIGDANLANMRAHPLQNDCGMLCACLDGRLVRVAVWKSEVARADAQLALPALSFDETE